MQNNPASHSTPTTTHHDPFLLSSFLQTVVVVGNETHFFPPQYSPLCELGYFGMITGFPLEGMHTLYILACGGFMEIIMSFLQQPPQSMLSKGTRVDRLADRILLCQYLTPSEFTRKVSSVRHLADWKAVEYRHFFMYLAAPLLEDLVDDDNPYDDHKRYGIKKTKEASDQSARAENDVEHSDEYETEGSGADSDGDVNNKDAPKPPKMIEMLYVLQVLMYLIAGPDPNPVPPEDIALAKKLAFYWVTWYIRRFKNLGWKPNTHWLLHLVADIEFHGCHLDELSVFRFENSMSDLKNMVQSGYLKLEQLRNRLVEGEILLLNRDDRGRIIRRDDGEPSIGIWDKCRTENMVKPAFSIEIPQKQGQKRENGKLMKKLRFSDFVLSNTQYKDRFCIMFDPAFEHQLETDECGVPRVTRRPWRHAYIVRVDDIEQSDVDGSVSILGTQYARCEPLFTEPEDSRAHDVFVFSEPSPCQTSFPVKCVVGKIFPIPRFKTLTGQLHDENIAGRPDLRRVVGRSFENVNQWVGVGLQHVKSSGFSSLY